MREIKFWRKAIQIIDKDYGEPCKDFNWDCVGCRANLMRSWIKNHIELLKW